MPYFTHIFEENVFNIFLLTPGGDPELMEKIRKRSDGSSQQVKETILVPGLKFNKLIELCQTRKIVWYITEDKWKRTADIHEPGEVKRMPGTLLYYQVPELYSLFNKYISIVAERHPQIKKSCLLRIQVDDFVDKEDEGSELSIAVTYYP
eukprot:EG_transcript_27561